MRLFTLVWSIVYVFLFTLPGHAQSISDYASVAEPPSWVEITGLDPSPFELGRDEAVEYLLSDRQARFDEAQDQYYLRSVTRLNTSSAVQDNSIVSVEFDPEYERVIFHSLRIIRGDQVIDLLDLAEFDLYRVETDRDRLIYNGTLQLSYVLPDLRIGDIVDYSSSLVGRNPALGPHFSFIAQHEYGVPARHIRYRLQFAETRPVYSKTFGGAPPPQRSRADGFEIYAWDGRDVPPVEAEDDQTADHYSFGQTHFSSFESWAEVGRYFAPSYDVTGPRPEALIRVASSIREAHGTDAARLRAALDFVQRDVRYLGIELGAGGYIPRRPETVLARRFGDCKDMVMLLTSLLDELGIEAAPLLVDLETRGAIAVRHPTYGAFDHVIVAATLAGKTYFLDPTRGEQLGDLENLQQGDFGKGVIIAPDSPGMIDVAAPMPPFFKVFKDRFVTTPESDAVRFINVSDYYMQEADSMSAWVNSSGLKEVDAEFLKYYQQIYPGLVQLKPLEMEVSEDMARVRFVAEYLIAEGWERDADNDAVRTLLTRPDELLAEVPDFVGAPRKTPYAIPHPKRVRHDLEVVLDDTWDLSAEDQTFDHPAFRYELRTQFTNGTYVQKHSYVTKSDRIEPGDFKATMASLNDISDDAGIYLTEDTSLSGLASVLSALTDEDIEAFFWAYVALVTGASLLGAYLTRNRDADRLSEQVFYPVSMMKFIILSMVTVGLYQVYWTYKNWFWIRKVQEENISPFWRTVFLSFTNFSLFPRFAKMSEKGFAWFGPAAIPLAILLLLSQALDTYTSKTPVLPDWLEILSLMAVLLPVPAAIQVLRLNRDNPQQVALNSRFGWPVLLMILGFSPLLVAVVWGITL